MVNFYLNISKRMMATKNYIILKNRGLLEVSGTDARNFLQGLVSNDITKVSEETTIYAALLSPQGKYLFDFFIFQLNGELVIDCEANRIEELQQKLKMYKLRSEIEICVKSDFVISALYGDAIYETFKFENSAGYSQSFLNGLAFIDPRISDMGGRAVIPCKNAEKELSEGGFKAGNFDEYETLRLKLGVPDGSRDMIVDKAILLENGFVELNGVDWNKGCYMGQELTARTHYRGLIKKRLLPVEIDGPQPMPGTPVKLHDKIVGEIRTGNSRYSLALLRLQILDEISQELGLEAGETNIYPFIPNWVQIKTQE